MVESFTGILYPERLPTFHRLPAPELVADLVRWFWIPEWDIQPGCTSRQHVMSFPTSNLVVTDSGVEFAGPTTRSTHRDLTGKGWAVGALLQPAAIAHFTDVPSELCDTVVPLDLPDLHGSIAAAMGGTRPHARRARAVEVFVDWFVGRNIAITADGLLANTMAELIGTERDVIRLGDVAARLTVSPRTLQRLARKYVGLTPTSLIRRRRLQEAADTARADPATDLATIAAEFGYTDQAHLAKDFQRYLGSSPSDYRRAVDGN
ncbi:AraC-like DNA-binding protein [Rhodococcus sp. 27YEA15]|uniref:AraC family transcriptional regulator n=1 Tax=Rhodococcus sp. 27YEA15 TaxID=3156259 RepID=UPI003C79DB9A